MKHFTDRFFRYPFIIIGSCLALTVFFALQLRGITVDNDNRIFFPQSHASYKRLVQTEKTFGSTVVIGVVLESPGQDFITAKNVAAIGRITSGAEKLKDVSDVQSMTNIDYLSGADGTLTSEKLVPSGFTGTPEEISALKTKLADWDELYGRVIVSEDGCSSMMTVTLDRHVNAQQKQAALKAVRMLVDTEIKGTGLKAVFVGDPVLSENSSLLMGRDLVVLIPLVILVVLLCLFFSFRTVDGTVLPLLTVLMGTCWSLGMMAMSGTTFTIVSTLIPVALVAVGSAYGIHVLNHYYIAFDEWKKNHPDEQLTAASHRGIVIAGLSDVFMPVFLAGITTIAGFISLVTSPLTPLKSFAVFSSAGVTFALLLSVTFIPAVLMVKPARLAGRKIRVPVQKLHAGKQRSSRDAGDTLYKIYYFFAGTKPRAIVLCTAIAVCSFAGIRALRIDTSLISYFPPDGQVRRDVAFVDKQFAGTNSLYFVVTGPSKGSMTSPDILKPVDDMQQMLAAKYPDVGKAVSFTTFVKRMNQVMHIAPAGGSTEDTGTVSAHDEAMIDDFDSLFADGGDGPAAEGAASGGTAAVQPAASYDMDGTMTLREGMELLKAAYVKAGGAHASADAIVDQLCRELNYDGAAYYEIPGDPAKYGMADREGLKDLVSQYLLLFSGSLDTFSDNQLEPSSIRIVIQLRKRSSVLTGQIMKDAEEYAAEHFPAGYTITATGTPELEYTMTNMIMSGQFTSLLFSLACVFIILAIAFKSVRAGVIGCIPLVLTIMLNYMVMGFAGINLDMFTSLIASLAVGIGIDYTIHFMTDYRENRITCGSPEEATRATFRKSGRGIVTNALSVGLGFIVLCFSNFVVLGYIGILVAAVMFTSSVLAMTIVPAILNTTDPEFLRRA